MVFNDNAGTTGIWSEGSLIPDVLADDERRTQQEDLTAKRKGSILSGVRARFSVRPNPDAVGEKPPHEIDSFSEVGQFDELIKLTAKKSGVDPDLVRATVHMETTHGGYDRILEPFDGNKTLRPMNVHAEYWKDLGFSRDELKVPENNIDAGVRLLKSIQDRIPGASVEQIASVYNSLGATKISDFGARVGRLYREKPWQK